MKNFSYTPQGVCTSNISFNISDGKLYNVKFTGGCMGNLQAISKLVEGKDATIIAQTLRGNDCRGKGTSCADQLAKAIETALIKTQKTA
ncbi:MAG: TIGR03905 family TSCPD domain-containing protein [Alphaproteobacteria bacterium]|nr:TIGR03905 family TSCPD domain-containing protein [Alphaproteobacteria bacterium]